MQDEVMTPKPADKPTKSAKQSRLLTLGQQVAELEAKAKAARERLKEEQKKEREKNAKAIAALIKDENLEEFAVEAWKQALPAVRAALEKADAAGAA